METTVAGCLVLMEATWQGGHERDSRPGTVCDLTTLAPCCTFWCFPPRLLSPLLKRPRLSLLSRKQLRHMHAHSPAPSELNPGYCYPFSPSKHSFNRQRNHLADSFLDHKTPNDGFGNRVLLLICALWSNVVYFLGQAWSAWKRGNVERGMKQGGCSCEAEMWSGACVALALKAVWQTHWHHGAQRMGGGGEGGGRRGRGRKFAGHPDAGKSMYSQGRREELQHPNRRISGTSP